MFRKCLFLFAALLLVAAVAGKPQVLVDGYGYYAAAAPAYVASAYSTPYAYTYPYAYAAYSYPLAYY
ncbi:unnamed protein product [Leptidea sinapis]|uniref:Uncharacterized protein n=1 Tax=Leptidea sinapis TaxID=189913 RepID=A0A5E4PV82_9NEOP|nr:unnamed protein product [Leptidea sinapis]